MWAVHGITTETSRLSAADGEIGQSIMSEWIETRSEEDR
jgi:hypothetical protein